MAGGGCKLENVSGVQRVVTWLRLFLLKWKYGRAVYLYVFSITIMRILLVEKKIQEQYLYARHVEHRATLAVLSCVTVLHSVTNGNIQLHRAHSWIVFLGSVTEVHRTRRTNQDPASEWVHRTSNEMMSVVVHRL